MYKIMIVEDDTVIADALCRHLDKWGYQSYSIGNFTKVLEEFRREKPQLILMDISLPFYDGFYWCSQIRKESQTPILFLSSADDDMNLVMAIHLGADDFIAKPFRMEVLTAKIQALLRRAYDFTLEHDVLSCKEALLYLSEARLDYGGNSCALTKNEFHILKLLMEQKGTVVSRDEIMRCLWEDESFIDDNTLTVNMARMRKKLETLGLTDFIRTKKGMGYMIEG